MTLNRFRGQIQSRIELLNMLITKKSKALGNSPSGALRISHSGKYFQYYQIEDDGSQVYISKKDIALIRQLAQKSYDKDVLSLAIKEKDCLERMLNKYPQSTMEELYETLPGSRQALINPVWLTDEEYAARWIAMPYERKEGENSEFGLVTNRGEKVRSKSEKIIADKLAERGIPYRYEAKLILDDGTVIHPDFTLLDIKRRREVYLEHLGMMDDSVYAVNAVKRIRLYEHNGIMIGDRLMLTFEANRIPIDTVLLDRMLDGLQ